MFWEDEKVQALVDEAKKQGLIIGGICAAISIFHRILGGVTVSCYPFREAKNRLREHGAIISGKSVTVDKRVVTGEHQHAVEWWSEALIAQINDEEWESPVKHKTIMIDELQ